MSYTYVFADAGSIGDVRFHVTCTVATSLYVKYTKSVNIDIKTTPSQWKLMDFENSNVYSYLQVESNKPIPTPICPRSTHLPENDHWHNVMHEIQSNGVHVHLVVGPLTGSCHFAHRHIRRVQTLGCLSLVNTKTYVDDWIFGEFLKLTKNHIFGNWNACKYMADLWKWRQFQMIVSREVYNIRPPSWYEMKAPDVVCARVKYAICTPSVLG